MPLQRKVSEITSPHKTNSSPPTKKTRIIGPKHKDHDDSQKPSKARKVSEMTSPSESLKYFKGDLSPSKKTRITGKENQDTTSQELSGDGGGSPCPRHKK